MQDSDGPRETSTRPMLRNSDNPANDSIYLPWWDPQRRLPASLHRTLPPAFAQVGCSFLVFLACVITPCVPGDFGDSQAEWYCEDAMDLSENNGVRRSALCCLCHAACGLL